MKRILVMGHGGYAEGIRKNLEMILGGNEHIYYIDLTKEDDLAAFESKVNHLLKDFPDDDILFACDLLGASPFRVAAMLCAGHPGKYYTVTGLNTMAFLELSMKMEYDLSIAQLADLAIDTAKAALAKFPE
ncbi:MAG: PTS sugar transporter subunit IIA [Eubacteriales bacterium]